MPATGWFAWPSPPPKSPSSATETSPLPTRWPRPLTPRRMPRVAQWGGPPKRGLVLCWLGAAEVPPEIPARNDRRRGNEPGGPGSGVGLQVDAAADCLLAFGRRLRALDFDVDRHLCALAQHAQADGFLLALFAPLLAQVADGAPALAVHLGDDVAGLQSGLFRGRAGLHFAHEHAFAVRRAEVGAELAAQVFGVNAEHRPAWSENRRAEFGHLEAEVEVLRPEYADAAVVFELVVKTSHLDRNIRL